MTILKTKWCRDGHPTRPHYSRGDHPKSYNMHEKIHGCLVFKCGVEGSPLLSVRCQEYAWRLCFSPKFKVQVLLNTEESSQVIHTCYPAWALHCVRPLTPNFKVTDDGGAGEGGAFERNKFRK